MKSFLLLTCKCIALVALIGAFTPAKADPSSDPVPPEFFGMTFYARKVPDCFVGKVGVLGKMPMTRWAYIQPKSREGYDWAGIDAQLAAMKKLGLTHFLYWPDGTPGWAMANHDPKTGKKNSYTGQWESYLPPDDMKDYTNFLQALLTRYPEINMIYSFCEPQNEPIPVATAVAMDRAMVDYVHANFPGVKVGTPTVQPRGTGAEMLKPGYWYYNYWTQGGPKDFDMLFWHGYPGLTVVHPSRNTVEEVARRRAALQMFIDHFGFQGKPVVDDESSWEMDPVAVNNHTDTPAFTSQDLLMHWSFGDSIFIWYAAAAMNCGTLATYPDGFNPAGVAWDQTRSWMLGSTLTSPGIGLNGVVRSGTWTRPGGYSAISAWTTDGSTSSFAVPNHTPPYVQYRDTAGKVTPISKGSVPIGGRPVWIETKAASGK